MERKLIRKNLTKSLSLRKELDTQVTNAAAFYPMCFDARYFKPQEYKVGRRTFVGYISGQYKIGMPIGHTVPLPDKFDFYVLLGIMQLCYRNKTNSVTFKSARHLLTLLGMPGTGWNITRTDDAINKWFMLALTVPSKFGTFINEHIISSTKICQDGSEVIYLSKHWLDLVNKGYWTKVSPTTVKKLGSAFLVNFYLHLRASSEAGKGRPFRRNMKKLHEKLGGVPKDYIRRRDMAKWMTDIGIKTGMWYKLEKIGKDIWEFEFDYFLG